MSTDLVIQSSGRTEVALPQDLIDKAREYAVNSRSERTRKEYARCWRDFVVWCANNKRSHLPASLDTIVAYVAWLASGRGVGKPLAVSSIGQAMAAVKLAQRTAGYAFDEKAPALLTVMKGIRREIAKTRTVRRVKPLMGDDLEALLEGLRPGESLRDARDAAMLALGWAAALRRVELVGLNWGLLGPDDDKKRLGFVTVDLNGISVTLMTSKAAQDTAETIVVPRAYAPLICDAVEAWVAAGGIEPGTPLFRAIVGKADGKRVAVQRMDPGTVARILKRRVQALLRSRTKLRRKMTRDEIKSLTELFSGHSMRVGYVSTARARRVDRSDVKRQTRHKSDAMIEIYDRDVDKFGDRSGLKGVGF